MEIPVGKTYFAHAFLGLVLLVMGTLSMSIDLGWAEFGSAQAIGTLFGMFAMIPLVLSVLIVAYSAIAAIVTLLRRQRVPRDMLLLPAGLLVGVTWGMMFDQFEKPFWTVVDLLPMAAYAIMTLLLVAKYQSARLRSARP